MKTWRIPANRIVNGLPTLLIKFDNKSLQTALYFGIFMKSYGKISRDLNDNGDLPLFICRKVEFDNIVGMELREYSSWRPKKL